MSIFDEIADEAADLSAAPTDDQMAKLREKCMEMVAAEELVSRLESQLEEAKKTKNTLAHKELPDIFAKMGIDSFGLSEVGEFGTDVIMQPYFKASIPAEWPDEQKKAAFDHLEEIGGGDLIKVELKYLLGRGQSELARQIAEVVRLFAESNSLDVPEPSIGQGVPWNSLTSFVKERHGKESSSEFVALVLEAAESGGRPPVTMDITKLNATVGMVVKVKERKK